MTVISSPLAFFFCCKIVCGRNLWEICVSHIKLARALCVAGDLKWKVLNKQHTLTHEIQLNVKTYPIHRTFVLSLIFCLFVAKSSFCFSFFSWYTSRLCSLANMVERVVSKAYFTSTLLTFSSPELRIFHIDSDRLFSALALFVSLEHWIIVFERF